MGAVRCLLIAAAAFVVFAMLPWIVNAVASPPTLFNATLSRKAFSKLAHNMSVVFDVAVDRVAVLSVNDSQQNESLCQAQYYFRDGDEGYPRTTLDYYMQSMKPQELRLLFGILSLSHNATTLAPRPPDPPARPSHPRATCVIDAPTSTTFRKRLADVLAVGEERLVQLGDTALGGGRSNYTYTFTDAPNNRTASHHEIFMTLASAHMLPVLSHLIDVKSVSCNASAERVLATTAVMYNFTLPKPNRPRRIR